MAPTTAGSEAVSYYTIPHFRYISGAQRSNTRVAYRSFNSSAERVVLIPTCFGQRINDVMNFTQGALQNYHVIVVGMLGGGESSSPSNDPDFPPDVRYEDCVNAQYELITQHLNIQGLEAVIGSSMGAQQAWYWAVMHGPDSPLPCRAKRIVTIVGSARTSDHCYAFLEGSAQSMFCASDYRDGPASCLSSPADSPVALRAFGAAFCAWTTSFEWYEQRLWESLGCNNLQEYLKTKGQTLFLKWHPQDILSLVRMWQHGNIACLRPGVQHESILAEIQAEVLVIPSRTDQYFISSDCLKEASHVPKGRVAVLDTAWGHIGGGGACEADAEFLDQAVADFLESTMSSGC